MEIPHATIWAAFEPIGGEPDLIASREIAEFNYLLLFLDWKGAV